MSPAEVVAPALPILSARHLDIWDRCERRYAFERDYAPMTISPIVLCYAALESALTAPDPEEEAKATAMRLCSSYDLQCQTISSQGHAVSAYEIATHHGYLAGIIAVALRQRLGLLTSLAPVLTDAYEWRSALYQDADGEAHRITLVSHWDDDRLRAEAHSWHTIGELAALGRPLTLHAIVIGPHRTGRRHSPWAKAVLHPTNGQLRFKRRSSTGDVAHKKDGHPSRKGDGFTVGWRDCWREKQQRVGTAEWLRVMALDDVLKELVISRRIVLDETDARLVAARKEMCQLVRRMGKASAQEPMRRSSCDETGRGPCPFQLVCYSKKPGVTPADLPRAYRAR